METLLKCRFMRSLLRGKKHDYDPNYLLSSYQDFKSLLLSVSDGEPNYRNKFRTIKTLHEVLSFRVENVKFKQDHGANIQAFASMALRQVVVELELLEKQLQYPELFASTASTQQPSPLHWDTSKFTKRDLIELITALEASNAIIDNLGNPISFTQLVESFSHLLNTPFTTKYAYKERDYILNFRGRAALFTDALSASLSKKDAKNHR